MLSTTNSNGQPKVPPESGSKRQRLLFRAVLPAAFLIAAVCVFISLRHSPQAKQPAAMAAAPESQAGPVSQPAPVPQAAAPGVPAPSKPAETVAVPAGPRSARQLMDELIELSAASGPITKEKAEKIRQDLAELIQQGAAAVPAIQDFLAKNREFNYEGGEGAEILGFPSMRASLIDALDQIGGPEAQGAMLQAIKTSATPAELLALANSLEKQAPGQYRDEILNAAQETLAMAATNQLQLGTNVELGPAFRMLRAYGDANTTADVSKTEPGNFYDAVVLASLPDGQGLPSLIQMAENSGSSQGGAMEMIAQLAGQNADALAALVGLAQKGQIPNSLWVRLASILGGEQYQIGGSAGQNAPGSQNYHIVSAATTPEEINQRISIIDALMPIVPEDSSAAHALSQQHDFLTAKLNQ